MTREVKEDHFEDGGPWWSSHLGREGLHLTASLHRGLGFWEYYII